MATMPQLVGFSQDYALGLLDALGVIPTLSYQTISAPQTTPGIILSQSPASGQTITGAVTLTLAGARKLPGVGVTCFSQPATLTGNDDPP